MSKWMLRAPFLILMALFVILVSPILAYQWVEDHWISPAWRWVWSD